MVKSCNTLIKTKMQTATNGTFATFSMVERLIVRYFLKHHLLISRLVVAIHYTSIQHCKSLDTPIHYLFKLLVHKV